MVEELSTVIYFLAEIKRKRKTTNQEVKRRAGERKTRGNGKKRKGNIHQRAMVHHEDLEAPAGQ